jgi:hypothetical protein
MIEIKVSLDISGAIDTNCGRHGIVGSNPSCIFCRCLKNIYTDIDLAGRTMPPSYKSRLAAASSSQMTFGDFTNKLVHINCNKH